jgi:formate C-acetyltransferase
MRAAQKTPENYENLIIRIGGFSVYFNRLPKELQNSVIERTEMVL